MKELNLALIKKRRKELRISLLEMSVLLGFKNASTYYKYEVGKSKFKAEHIPIVASKLKLKMSEIFFTPELAKLAN